MVGNGLPCIELRTLGANMMMAMPRRAIDAPTRSQVVGLIPSTAYSHWMATKYRRLRRPRKHGRPLSDIAAQPCKKPEATRQN